MQNATSKSANCNKESLPLCYQFGNFLRPLRVTCVKAVSPGYLELVAESAPTLSLLSLRADDWGWRSPGPRKRGLVGCRVAMPKAVGESPTPSLSLRIPEQSVAARRETPFSRKGDNAAFAPRRSCSIPGLLCVWDVHASLGLCRSPLPLAFDLEKPSEMMGARLMTRTSRAHPA